MVDLGGRAVLPGLVDGHAHLMMLARSRLSLDLRARRRRRTSRRGSARPRRAPGEWLTGRGWDQTRWPERAGSRRRHRSIGSRRASGGAHPRRRPRDLGELGGARAAGVTGDGGAGGRPYRPGADGEPAGLLIDTAQDWCGPSNPPSDRALRAGRARVNRGVPRQGAHRRARDGADLDAIAAYRRLIERGRFPFRHYVAVSGAGGVGRYRERGPETVGDGRLVVGAVKLWLDGALGSRGAALHAPYCDDPGNTGLVLVPPEDVERLTLDALARGFHVCVHAIGDRANTLVLDAFERGPGGPPPARRHGCEWSTPRSSPTTSRASAGSA